MKRRRTLGRFDHAQPAAGAGSKEEQPSAALQAMRDQPDRARDRPAPLRDGADHARVFAVHEGNELFGGELVKIRTAGVALLGGQSMVWDAGHTFCQDSMGLHLMLQ